MSPSNIMSPNNFPSHLISVWRIWWSPGTGRPAIRSGPHASGICMSLDHVIRCHSASRWCHVCDHWCRRRNWLQLVPVSESDQPETNQNFEIEMNENESIKNQSIKIMNEWKTNSNREQAMLFIYLLYCIPCTVWWRQSHQYLLHGWPEEEERSRPKSEKEIRAGGSLTDSVTCTSKMWIHTFPNSSLEMDKSYSSFTLVLTNAGGL